jgi:hypothetical protein
MPDKKSETVVLLAQVHKEFDTYRVMAHVRLHQLDGEMRGANWDYGNGSAREYEGFAVHAYLGNNWDSEQGVWGQGFSYSPSRIESAQQAKAIARVMEKLERGLDKLISDEGYVASDDFAGYLLRIARVLRIKQIWTRSTKRHQDMTGEYYRLVNGSSLQYWVKDLDEAARAGRCAELLRT